MSLLKKIGKVFKKALPAVSGVLGSLPGPLGMIGGIAGGALARRQETRVAEASFAPMVMPGVGAIAGMGARLGGAAIGAGRVAMAGARSIARSAMTYCRRHPGWCATIGGTAAVEALIARGELPPIKRRRGRGITSTELRNFKRVARFTSRYCAPVRKAMKAPAMRRRGPCA